jgi:DNA-binding helix-hairpin-helix protein with protein kinase domain
MTALLVLSMMLVIPVINHLHHLQVIVEALLMVLSHLHLSRRCPLPLLLPLVIIEKAVLQVGVAVGMAKEKKWTYLRQRRRRKEVAIAHLLIQCQVMNLMIERNVVTRDQRSTRERREAISIVTIHPARMILHLSKKN